MKKIEYGRWEIHPCIAEGMLAAPGAGTVVWKRMAIKHEGEVLYYKLWNFLVRVGTTAEQAASLCSSHLEATGRSVGSGAPPLAARPPSGRICPGSLNVLSSLIVGTGAPPALYPNECRQGTSLLLLP
jgi:hypothetical protein